MWASKTIYLGRVCCHHPGSESDVKIMRNQNHQIIRNAGVFWLRQQAQTTFRRRLNQLDEFSEIQDSTADNGPSSSNTYLTAWQPTVWLGVSRCLNTAHALLVKSVQSSSPSRTITHISYSQSPKNQLHLEITLPPPELRLAAHISPLHTVSESTEWD